MKFQTIIVTCRERERVLQQTLSNLAATDWPGQPHLQMDRMVTGDCRQRQTENVRLGLGWFVSQSDADYLLLLEDDLEFNTHLWWNLERWLPMVDGRLDFGSLYNPNIRNNSGDDYFIAHPGACYGSQAYVLSRAAVHVLLRDWLNVIGMQDIKITRILGAAGYPLFYHRPSLVQHVGIQSVWGGGYHSAPDFQPGWKSVFSYERIPGWFTFPRLYERAVAEARHGDVLVEVGAWLGRSTAYLGGQVKASGKQIRVMVVDTFQGSATDPQFYSAATALGGSVRQLFDRNMRLAELADRFEVREGYSVDVARSLPDCSCSFVFIDADHGYDSVRADIRAWRRKVRPGGVLAGHDCFTFPAVFAAVRDELAGDFATTDENVWIHQVNAVTPIARHCPFNGDSHIGNVIRGLFLKFEIRSIVETGT